MNTRDKGISWKEFDNFVRNRQSSFRQQEAKRQERLQRKVAEEFARSNTRLFPDRPKSSTAKGDPRPDSKSRLRFTNPFRKYRPAAKPRNGILKSIIKNRTKDLRQNVNPSLRSYHDDTKPSFFPKKYFTVERPDLDGFASTKPSSTVLPPLQKVPKPPTGKGARGKNQEPPSLKSDLTFYDKPLRQFPVDSNIKDSKPRTRYPSPVPSPPPSPPISGFRESPRPPKSHRKPKKRTGVSPSPPPPPSSPRPTYNNDRYNRISPRLLEDTYNLSPRPRRTPEVVSARRRSPSNLSQRSRSPSPSPSSSSPRQRPRDEFTPMKSVPRATSMKDIAPLLQPPSSGSPRQDGDDLHLPNLFRSSQKRAYLLSGVDGPSLGTRPSRTYHFNPGTTVDDRDFKTVIPAADSPVPRRRPNIDGRPRRRREQGEGEEDEGGEEGSLDNSPSPDDDDRRSRRPKGSTRDSTQPQPQQQQGQGAFRYKRDLNTKSRGGEDETTTTRLPPVNQPRQSSRGRNDDDGDGDSQTNSLSTTHLSDLGDIPPTSSRVRGHRPVAVQRAFDHQSPTRMSSINEYGDDDSQQSIDELEENYKVSGPDNYSKHDSWPIHRYRHKGAIACMVRASPGSIEEVKRRLRLVDGGLSAVDQQRMPPLPAMEFDADEHIVLSPMQLVWDKKNTNNNGKESKQRPTVASPIYIIMPVNTAIYNDALQQLMFIYTVDYREWQYAEGRLIQLPIDGLEHQFYEAVIREPFNNVIFDIKARYLENTRIIGADGGEVSSTMEPGVRFFVHKRTYDDSTKVKLRVEPLDMNETDLANLIPGPHTQNAVAVSPVIKITSSEPTKRPIIVYLPKPGTSFFGSTRLGLRNKVWDLRNIRVHLYTKDRQVSKYQHDPSVQREFSNEYEFSVRIWKAGGSAYAFLVMTGTEPQLNPSYNFDNEEKGFLSMFLFRRLSTELGTDELKIRSLGRHLLNFGSTNDIFRSHSDQVPLATMKILKRWKNSSRRLEEGAMIRQLVLALKESGFPKEAMGIQTEYGQYLTEEEGHKMMLIFDELRSCPAVVVNWQILGRALGLIDDELEKIRRHSSDLRKRCYAVLRMSFEVLKGSEQFFRDVVLRYINALQRIGCPRIAASVERRHLSKFYMNVL